MSKISAEGDNEFENEINNYQEENKEDNKVEDFDNYENYNNEDKVVEEENKHEDLGEDKEREEFEIERKVWSNCFLCEEEYATKQLEGGKEERNIVMNIECSHSYCKECIEQSASTSLLCPICHSSLPTPLSSLPINYTLCYWQTLSPPLPPFTLPSQPIGDKLEEEIQKICENCEEKKGEIYCSMCDSALCVACSEFN